MFWLLKKSILNWSCLELFQTTMTQEQVTKSWILILNLLHLLNKKWKLTQDIVDNVVWMLIEESWMLLEKNMVEAHLDTKRTINMIDTVGLV